MIKRQLKWFVLLALFGIINPIMMFFNLHGIVAAAVGSFSWLIFVFSVVMFGLTKYYSEKEIQIAFKTNLKIMEN